MGFRHTAHEVVTWLQGGYPQGVPSGDYVALLGILRRRLTDAEVEYVAEQMMESSSPPVSAQQIRELLRTTTLQQASEEDVRRVSAILAAGGWPLADVETVDEDHVVEDPRPNPILRFVEWIRLGYPAGVPSQDYQPLLSLLHRRLSDGEVEEVCRALVSAGIAPLDRIDVGVEVSRTLNQLPTSDEVGRVLSRLHAVGWPILDDGLED